eukprot:UC4_evm2s812
MQQREMYGSSHGNELAPDLATSPFWVHAIGDFYTPKDGSAAAAAAIAKALNNDIDITPKNDVDTQHCNLADNCDYNGDDRFLKESLSAVAIRLPATEDSKSSALLSTERLSELCSRWATMLDSEGDRHRAIKLLHGVSLGTPHLVSASESHCTLLKKGFNAIFDSGAIEAVLETFFGELSSFASPRINSTANNDLLYSAVAILYNSLTVAHEILRFNDHEQMIKCSGQGDQFNEPPETFLKPRPALKLRPRSSHDDILGSSRSPGNLSWIPKAWGIPDVEQIHEEKDK